MSNPRSGPPKEPGRKRLSADDTFDVPGDPGVGGLLADPEAPVVHKQSPRPTGTRSPDPEPPKAHGDWLPTHKSQPRSDR